VYGKLFARSVSWRLNVMMRGRGAAGGGNRVEGEEVCNWHEKVGNGRWGVGRRLGVGSDAKVCEPQDVACTNMVSSGEGDETPTCTCRFDANCSKGKCV
jgi:hypothetical protein